MSGDRDPVSRPGGGAVAARPASAADTRGSMRAPSGGTADPLLTPTGGTEDASASPTGGTEDASAPPTGDTDDASASPTRGARVPLLAPRSPGPLAWRHGEPVSPARFVAAARALAGRLPDGRPVNLCQDRLLFAVGLAAALLRGQPSLLPPNALPETLRQAPRGDGQPYLLLDGDTPAPAAGLRVQRVRWPAAEADPADVDAACLDATAPTVDGDADAVCLLTSGSTGAPQPHAKRWAALMLNIGAEAARLAEHLGRPSLAGLTVVATVPAQHSYGLESSVLLALLGGAAFDAGRPYYPADIAAALTAVPRPRALVTTPFHLKALLRSGVALPPVDLVLSATAPLSPQLAQQAETAFGGVLVEIYGCTEAGQVASRRTTDGETWTTLGALRLRAVRPGDVGGSAGSDAGGDGTASAAELADDPLRSTVEGGHVERPTVLADRIERHDARRFRLLGRANDLIHVGGKRTSLGHLDFHLNRIDGVDDGAFWLPEGDDAPADGETVVRPVALVVAPRLTAAQVTAALRGVLEPVFVPRRVLHVDALPREATGKLTAATLRAVAQRALGNARTPPAVSAGDAGDAGDAGTAVRTSKANAAVETDAAAPLVATAKAVSVEPLPPVAALASGVGVAPAAAPCSGVAPTTADAPAPGDDGVVVRRLVFDAAHPALPGHFPGRPVLPGTVLLAAVLDAVADVPALRRRLGAAPRVEQAKFLAPVVPAAAGTALRLTLRPDARGVDVEVRFDDGAAGGAATGAPLASLATVAPPASSANAAPSVPTAAAAATAPATAAAATAPATAAVATATPAPVAPPATVLRARLAPGPGDEDGAPVTA